MTDILYRICPTRPEAHVFEVTLTVAAPEQDGQRLWLPAWIPGSYMIREFARNVVWLRAEAQGRPVPTEKLDKDTWRCAPCAGPLTVTYEVYAWDLSVRAAHLDTTHGYFNGTSVFLAVAGREQQPCEVLIEAPAGEGYRDWRVATTLARVDAPLWGFGRYRAEDYDDLVDHPVEMGSFALETFEVAGVPHALAVTGRQQGDLARLARDLQRICTEHVSLFGELPPMERYLFQLTVVGNGYGGLEHRSSTSLLANRDDLPLPGEGMKPGYRSLLGLCSHEYFHTWNVKRIKPAEFVPYDLQRENYTRQLWAFEGITSYYDDLALVRSGLIELKDYLELLGQTATRVWRGSGRHKQTLEESSFDAWTKFYRQDENAPNAIVSYYTKGALTALALDLTLRRETAGRVTLDEVMRALWIRYGKRGEGVPAGGVEAVAQELVQAAGGGDLATFFDQALRSTEDLPLGALLGEVGVQFRLRAAEPGDDRGGKPAAKQGAEAPRASLGVRTAKGQGGARLVHVFDGGAAQAAGLSAGDAVIALDGLRVDHSTLEQRVARLAPDTEVTLHAFRRDELHVVRARLQPPVADVVYLEAQEAPPAEAAARRAQWLASVQGGAHG
ncbi:M61 family metallopeptidase [Ectothiorhodospiraceae bacterium 2226]|nr:M61 family metallopeptidase [Ectothiorhodospiraceae bacterium 2226]